MGRHLISLAILVLLFAMPGCETPPAQKGAEPGERAYGVTGGTFPGNWWNYYERGLSFADGKYWAEAEADLREAMHQRGEDQSYARTYGVRFVDYFPHRELGVVLFHQSRYEEAIRELERSLKAEKSAKAEFYLDRSRKALIEQDKRDGRPPEFSIRSPEEDFLTNDLTCLVSGVARDDLFVKKVMIDDSPVRIDVAATEVPFGVEVQLEAGRNRIRVQGEDLSGKVTIVERTVWVDRDSPVLSIEEPAVHQPGRPGAMRLRGYVSDESGVSSIRVNGREAPCSQGRVERLDVDLSALPPEESSQTLVIEARDRAGNEVRATLPFPSVRAAHGRVMLASLIAEPALRLVSAEAASGPASDIQSPRIELNGWTEEQTVFYDKIYLDGLVEDDRLVSSLTINGDPVFMKPGKKIFFGRILRLAQGDNTLSVAALDAAGNRTEKKILVRRENSTVRDLGARLRLYVAHPDRERITEPEHQPIEEYLIQSFVEEGRFAMVERRHLDQALDGSQVSRSDLADPQKALRVGKLVGADGALIVSAASRAHSLVIRARLVDTETSAIITATDVYAEDVDLPMLKELCKGLTVKMCDELPVVEGTVLDVTARGIFTDLGGSTRIKKGMRIIVFEEREPIRSGLTGKILGMKTEKLAQGLIKAVEPQTSEAEIYDQSAAGILAPAQKVITR